MNRLRVTVAAAFASTVTACTGLPAAAPTCSALDVLAIQAQSVPSSEQLVCLADVPDGWTVSAFSVDDHGTAFVLDHAVAGSEAANIEVAKRCRMLDDTFRSAPDQPTERLQRGAGRLTGYRSIPLSGGCASVRLDLRTDGWQDLLDQLDDMLRTIDRSVLRDQLLQHTGGRLDLDAIEG